MHAWLKILLQEPVLESRDERMLEGVFYWIILF